MLVAAAIAIGSYAKPVPAGVPGGATARVLPRMPPPPSDLPNLLFQLGVGSVVWYGAAVAVPFMLAGARHLDIERHGRARTAAVAAAVVALLIAATGLAEYVIVYRGVALRPPLAAFGVAALRQNTLPWLAVAGLVAAVESRRRVVRSAVAQERFRAEVAEQRLIALTGQLQPHFLFNTLQSISTLIHRDPDAADDMLTKLADLLRDLLRHRDRVIVPLGDEVRYARTYLEIAAVRFGDRLAFEVDAADPLHEASVPLFILQPLVENALTHGIGARLKGGRITVTGRRDGDRLHLDVADDGAGLPLRVSEGIGLSNTRERLRGAFGSDQRLSIGPRPGGGTIARIDVPYRRYEPSGSR